MTRPNAEDVAAKQFEDVKQEMTAINGSTGNMSETVDNGRIVGISLISDRIHDIAPLEALGRSQ